MMYIGYKNERSSQPTFHRTKNGEPLCGAELTNAYTREGLPPLYWICKRCNERHTGLGHVPNANWTQDQLAAENIKRCQAFNSDEQVSA